MIYSRPNSRPVDELSRVKEVMTARLFALKILGWKGGLQSASNPGCSKEAC